ncbi:bacterioferritin-associated ferredoxin [Microbulbifer thermotolerans]|uniref:Bacterioferritin-associated ferredoxin n=1 Tax=Microbulbifer thermotolerans TaxID=252514 RepID=A0A143HKC7_MICTH|nr:bacterioferritin-associated ferredoxin [Microbulbifer thermotolerans]AMX02123.1 (2Fe-2S)-binding protein [Microbulbifer thermotolerans]MCX2778917.1 bacterioferritin-associated ferredoxin [Microbulbifer thermotolerans]MCX2781451.1 bacterioferritin-associated ferredoxin [Microbulbifer thermotolerans]MCX2793803.1 bacterioferritin-associated ferredoxin [Microbulbifer thermotolerans]MCX2802363.1 bacterioferritin-associated ferredoxin [Microbulbifer thermotolerans]
MYVCICKGITDRQIKEAVYDGSTSVKALRRHLGVSSQCGRCAQLAREIIDETMAGGMMTAGNSRLFYSAS